MKKLIVFISLNLFLINFSVGQNQLTFSELKQKIESSDNLIYIHFWTGIHNLCFQSLYKVVPDIKKYKDNADIYIINLDSPSKFEKYITKLKNDYENLPYGINPQNLPADSLDLSLFYNLSDLNYLDSAQFVKMSQLIPEWDRSTPFQFLIDNRTGKRKYVTGMPVESYIKSLLEERSKISQGTKTSPVPFGRCYRFTNLNQLGYLFSLNLTSTEDTLRKFGYLLTHETIDATSNTKFFKFSPFEKFPNEEYPIPPITKGVRNEEVIYLNYEFYLKQKKQLELDLEGAKWTKISKGEKKEDPIDIWTSPDKKFKVYVKEIYHHVLDPDKSGNVKAVFIYRVELTRSDFVHYSDAWKK